MYLVLICAESITFTVVYLHTRGSVPVAITFHLFLNAASNIVFGLCGEPSADLLRQIYFVRVLLHVALAIAVLGWHARWSHCFAGGERRNNALVAPR